MSSVSQYCLVKAALSLILQPLLAPSPALLFASRDSSPCSGGAAPATHTREINWSPHECKDMDALVHESDHRKKVQAAICSHIQPEINSPAFPSQLPAEYAAAAAINFYRGGEEGEKCESSELSPNLDH